MLAIMARNLSRKRQWAGRRRIAATAGLFALFLQFCASLVPPSAMADMAIPPPEAWGLRLCLADEDVGKQPAKQKSGHVHDQCQLCQTLKTLSWASTPRAINVQPPQQIVDAPRFLPRLFAASLPSAAAFSSRAPPRIA